MRTGGTRAAIAVRARQQAGPVDRAHGSQDSKAAAVPRVANGRIFRTGPLFSSPSNQREVRGCTDFLLAGSDGSKAAQQKRPSHRLREPRVDENPSEGKIACRMQAAGSSHL